MDYLHDQGNTRDRGGFHLPFQEGTWDGKNTE